LPDRQDNSSISPDHRLRRQAFARLGALLPLPRQDTPDVRAPRDDRACPELLDQYPSNAAETARAVQVGVCIAHALSALRCVGQPGSLQKFATPPIHSTAVCPARRSNVWWNGQ
jgi:hypothetical protein